MTTSSDNRSPSPPRLGTGHWTELSKSLSDDSVATLDRWFDERLSELETRQEKFITRQSLRKNLRG